MQLFVDGSANDDNAVRISTEDNIIAVLVQLLKEGTALGKTYAAGLLRRIKNSNSPCRAGGRDSYGVSSS